MAWSRSQWQPGALGFGSAFAFLLISSCSLRDTSFLDSQPSGGGAGGDGTAGANNTDAGTGGSGASAGNGSAGDSSGGVNARGGGGGLAGSDVEAGAGGMEEPPPTGTFANCPARTTWSVLSNPTVAWLQAHWGAPQGSEGQIVANQLQPEYAIDDGDTTGTVTRFASGAPMGNAENGEPEFLSVDMGAERWVSGVYTKEPSPGDYGRKIEVSVSRDGNTFDTVATVDGMPGAYDILFQPVIARYVRLTQTGQTATEWWSVHDYKVYCTADTVPAGGAGGGGAGGGGGAATAGAGGGGAGGTAGKAGTGGT